MRQAFSPSSVADRWPPKSCQFRDLTDAAQQ